MTMTLTLTDSLVVKFYLFIYNISIAPLQVTIYSEALLTTVRTLCWSFHTKAHRAIVSK